MIQVFQNKRNTVGEDEMLAHVLKLVKRKKKLKKQGNLDVVRNVRQLLKKGRIANH